MNWARRLLIAIGHPLYLALKFILWPGRWRPRPRPRVIYRAPSPLLKNFLKAVYPLVSFRPRLPRLPRLVIGRWPWVILPLSLGILAFYFYILKDLPRPSSLTTQAVPLTTHIRDRHGAELYKIYRAQNRTLVKLAQVPLYLRQATISIEDAGFYRHSGFSLRGTGRAAWRILTNQHLEGGSTITQQLVKTALLSPERTFRRKLRELVLAIAVETTYSKDQILEMYLNRVGYGGAAYGVEEASRTYFGKPVSQVTLAEAALLAGLPASPTTYSPFGAHPELAKGRQKEALRRMVANGYITWDQAQAASVEELKFAPPATDIKAPHFVMYVKQLLADKYGTDVVEQGGLEVVTSLDLSLQQLAQNAVSDEVTRLAHLRITNGAAVVTHPQTGEILAMVGSRDYFDTTHDGNVNVTLAPRQPGSAIKPLNYALAFTRGFTPASLIDDSAVTYRVPGQPPYSPVNYDRRFHGQVTLRTALASSYNIPAVKLLWANGVNNMINLGRSLGISTWSDNSRYGLSLTLGGGEVTMLDMAVVYGVLANLGVRVDLQPILAVTDSRGRLLEEFRCLPASQDRSAIFAQAAAEAAATEITSCLGQPVLDPKVAYLIWDILSDNAARAPAFGARSDLVIPGSAIAVKTGTTNNLRDNWTIGYTPYRLVAVWVGNNDNTPMSYVASGVTGASPIWRRIMTQLVKDTPSPVFSVPPDLVKANICTLTGQLACEGCPSRAEYFLPGTEPKAACTKEQIETLLAARAKKEEAERDKLDSGAATP